MAFDTDEEGVLIWKLGEAFCNGQFMGTGITRSYMILLSLTKIAGPGFFQVWQAKTHYLSKHVRSHDVCGEDGVSPPEGLVGPFVDSSIKHHKLNYL
eukprot:scaffold246200_cov27-Attheya_sp.AAC.1